MECVAYARNRYESKIHALFATFNGLQSQGPIQKDSVILHAFLLITYKL